MPKILIVDDEWLTRLEIEEMLTDLGYDVAGQAETGAEAVAMARELNPDLILMDVKMPGEMNGIDAAREIKAELGTPIVFISGYGDPEYIEAAKEIAPFGYVMKPFDEREIHAFVEIALSRRELELELEESHERLEQTNLDLQSEIAARKKTETALQESQKLYRDIFEKNNAMKWLLDTSSGEIIDANPAACEFYQYSHAEITKLRLWDINIESEANVRKLLANASSDGNTEFMFKHRLASGEIRDVQVYTGALESGGKKILHSIMVDMTERKQAEDKVRKAYAEVEKKVEERTIALSVANADLTAKIAEHKRAEEALRKSEERYSSIVENSLNAIIVYEQKDILFANEAFFKVFGYDRKDLQGIVVDDILAPEVAKATTELRRLRMAGVIKKSTVYETKGRRKDGEIFDIEISVCLVPYQNKRFCMAFLADINKRKQAENELANNTKSLEETNIALNILLEKRERDKKDIEERMVSNVRMMVEPYLNHLRKRDLDNRQSMAIDLIESGLNEIVSSFSVKLSSKHLGLTPGELRVAYLIKEGKRTKDIADLLNLSTKTIEGFRKNLRKKLGLTNTKMNLRTHLISIQ